MEELIFSLITCFLHRRFFPKGEVLRRASRHYRRMPGKARDRLRPFGSGQRE